MGSDDYVGYLRGSAKVWYDNHEEELKDWEAWKLKLRNLFGLAYGRIAPLRKN